MRIAVLALAFVAAAAMGCGHAEQERQAQEYERFLKDSLGTVATDAPAPVHASQPATSAVD